MDSQKDIPTPDHLSRFFDDHAVKTNPFGENRSAERVYRRTERLCAALHLLTNHIPINEPLRESVRENALKLLQHILSIRDEMRAPESAKLSSLRSLIRHLISLVRMLTVSGFASLQNGSVVVEALDELGNFLSASQRSALSESISLTREDFIDVHSPIVRKTVIRPIQTVKDAGSVKDKVTSSESVIENASQSVTLRQESILEVLRSGGELGIRDIASNLPEYSEKMIQRELLELVARGRVKKSGLKRWSRYSRVD